MVERTIEIGGLEIWTEDFGDPSDPVVLLNAGGGAPGVIWSEAFCESLAAGGRHVIRYDYRDIGLSSRVDFEASPYTLADLTADAVGVLDAYGVTTAHFVGWSMGGQVAQCAALDHPDRVASVTSISSTPLRGAAYGASESDLPGVSPAFLEAGAAMMAVPLSDVEGRVDATVAFFVAGGITEPFDEEELRTFARRAMARTQVPQNSANHILAGAGMPERRNELARVTAPTLVVHGTNDLALGVEHGRATADAIPGAKLLLVDGMGHIPRPEPPQMLTAILEHTAPVGSRS